MLLTPLRRAARTLVHLKTLGHPSLCRADGRLVEGLRRKDLALLVYLCVEGAPAHARSRLAALLWGESPEERARHSLTQALGRLVRVLPAGVVVPDKEAVRWSGGLDCEADVLLRGNVRPGEVDDAFSLYPGHFLEGFDPGAGTEDFRGWADRRRAELRNAALRLLERAGEQAEAAGAWSRALRLGERAVEIDPVWEQGHRRIMRALAARGERNGALRHYQAFEAWLAEDVGGEPDADTRALAHQLRAPDPPEPRPAPAPPALRPPEPSAPPRTVETAPTVDDRPQGIVESAPVLDERPPRASEAADPPPSTVIPPPPGESGARRNALIWLILLLVGTLVALGVVIARRTGADGEMVPEVSPAHGESVRLRGADRIFLAFGETLYEFPDSSTLCVCTGWYPRVVREVRALPPWPRQRLPSVREHAWMSGTRPVVSDDPIDRTAYVAVGCILPSIPDPPTLDSIFGPQARRRVLQVADSVLNQLPRAFIARGHPLRPAGTLIRGPDHRIRWITYHGGALEVTDPELLATHCRSPDEAVPVDPREYAYYRPWGTLSRGTGDCTG